MIDKRQELLSRLYRLAALIAGKAVYGHTKKTRDLRNEYLRVLEVLEEFDQPV
jgi:hypothetical protein